MLKLPGSTLLACFAATSLIGAESETPRGYTALFDGQNLDAFKTTEAALKHWRVEDGVLKYDGKENDLWTRKSYKNFVLKVDWRFPDPGPRREVDDVLPSGEVARDDKGQPKKVDIQYGGDSGIYLRGSSKSQVNIWNWPIGSGEVYGYRTDGAQPAEVRAGVTPRVRADKPLGEWNSFTIWMVGDRLSVDLNGKSVLAHARLPGVAPEGPLALQNHGDPVEFRNIHVRELADDVVALTNGKDLAGWKVVAGAPDTWSVRDGKLVCTGKPTGYVRTEKEYEDYVFECEWLFPHGGGSTGLLFHIQGADKVWPATIEIQTDHKSVGNFIKIGAVSFEGGRRSDNFERPVGEWNHIEVISRGGVMECHVNGKKASEGKNCSPTRGTIGIQSEGVEVHYRNLWLRPLTR